MRRPKTHSKRKATTPLRIVLWALGITLLFGAIEFGGPVEDLWRGARNYTLLRPADGKVVIVGIDEKTFSAYGTETLPQRHDAALIDALFANGAKRVFFDRTYADLTATADDKLFIDVLSRHGNKIYLGAIKIDDQQSGKTVDILPNPAFRKHTQLATLIGLTTPFQLSAKLALAADIKGEKMPSISSAIAGTEGKPGELYRPDWSIDMKTIPTVSFVDVAQGKTPRRLIEGKDIIVGPTSSRSHDFHRIAGQGWMPGVYFHAVGAQTLREGPSVELGWVPAYLAALALALAVIRARSVAERRSIIGVAVLGSLGLPFLFDHLLVHADYLPGYLLFWIVAYRTGTLFVIRQNKNHNDDTNMPTLSSLYGEAKAKDRPIVVLHLRNFAAICASFEADVEARLMRAIADRVGVGDPNTAFYQGEQQLVWLGPDIPSDRLEDHLKGIARIIQTSIEIDDRRVDIQMSFGIDNARAHKIKRRIAAAQLAATQAAERQSLVGVYDPDRQEHDAWQLSMLGEMDQAIDDGGIWVAYQPQYDLRRQSVCGAEALVRWEHPVRGSIPADEFIAAAEKHNRIERLTRVVLLSSMEATREIVLDCTRFKLAVNISAALLNEQPDFAGYIRLLAREAGFPLMNLTLEITETAQIVDQELAKQSLLSLAQDGVTIAIDDYGTGNSSLAYVRAFPAAEIKIDKSFITDMRRNPRDALMVESTIGLAHGLNKRVVAEGVEDQATLDQLKRYGCDIIQGYHIGRPMCVADLTTLIRRENISSAA